MHGLQAAFVLHCPPSTRSRSYANSGIRVSHQTSHIFTRTLSECDMVRVNVAIVYGDDSFVASVWSSGTSKKHDMFGTNSFITY